MAWTHNLPHHTTPAILLTDQASSIFRLSLFLRVIILSNSSCSSELLPSALNKVRKMAFIFVATMLRLMIWCSRMVVLTPTNVRHASHHFLPRLLNEIFEMVIDVNFLTMWWFWEHPMTLLFIPLHGNTLCMRLTFYSNFVCSFCTFCCTWDCWVIKLYWNCSWSWSWSLSVSLMIRVWFVLDRNVSDGRRCFWMFGEWFRFLIEACDALNGSNSKVACKCLTDFVAHRRVWAIVFVHSVIT